MNVNNDATDKAMKDAVEQLSKTEEKKPEHTVHLLWKAFLEMSKCDERKMPPHQLTVIKRAFYGGVGQLLMVQGYHLSKLSEIEAQAINHGFVDEIKEFWDKQEDRENKSQIIGKPKIITMP